MKKKVFLFLSLALVLIGVFYTGNHVLNQIFVNKLEDVLKKDEIQKEVAKLAKSIDIDMEKELSQMNVQDMPKEIEINEQSPKANSVTEKKAEPPSVPKTAPVSTNTVSVAAKEPKPAAEENNKEKTKNIEKNEQVEFASKSEAIEFVKSRFTAQEISQLFNIYSEAMKDGLTVEEKIALKERAYEEAFKKFTHQEIEAVKKIILGES